MNPVDLLVGAPARALLDDPQFAAAWNDLWTRCPHATVFQSTGFARAWYDVYESVFQPVIARCQAGNALTGLWLLAFDPARNFLVHAGAHQAEYHVWLATPETQHSFLDSAWRQLTAALPFARLSFKYLPHAQLAAVLCDVPRMSDRITTRIVQRPLVMLDAARIDAALHKPGNRSRLNRLSRLGAPEFRALHDFVDLEALWDDFIDLYDFRNGALNDSLPFREDPRKRDFYTRWFRAAPGDTVLTATYLAGRPIAIFWGARTGTSVHLGMLAHSPFFSRHSPGKMHLLRLNRHLLAKGMEILDLTPGDDPWKERFANGRCAAAESILHSTAGSRRRVELSRRARTTLEPVVVRLGVRPAHVGEAIAKMRRATPAAVFRRWIGWVGNELEFRIYRAERGMHPRFERDPRVAVNRISDLLCFRQSERWETRQAFLRESLSRLERGERVYTVCLEGRLAMHMWVVKQRKSVMTEVRQSLELPAGSMSAYDAYAPPEFRGRGLMRTVLSRVLHDAFADESISYVYCSMASTNSASRRSTEAAGFRYLGSLHCRRRFGRQQRWADASLAQEAAHA